MWQPLDKYDKEHLVAERDKAQAILDNPKTRRPEYKDALDRRRTCEDYLGSLRLPNIHRDKWLRTWKEREVKTINLFDDIQGEDGLLVEAPPEQAPPRPEDINKDEKRLQARERLGLPHSEPWDIQFTTVQEADAILQRRAKALAMLAYTLEQQEQNRRSQDAWEQEVADIDLYYGEALEAYAAANLPGKKKSLVLPNGDLKFRDQPASVSLDGENDPDESLFQAWLKTRPAEFKEQLGVEERIRYTRNMDAFSKWFLGEWERTKKAPTVPGVKHKPAQANKFSVAPSLSTFKKNTRDSIKEQING